MLINVFGITAKLTELNNKIELSDICGYILRIILLMGLSDR